MGLNSAVASLFCGGAPGAIHMVTASFHLPAILVIFSCSGPGVAAFMYFSMIAFSSMVEAGFAFAFAAGSSGRVAKAAVKARHPAAAEIFESVMRASRVACRIERGSRLPARLQASGARTLAARAEGGARARAEAAGDVACVGEGDVERSRVAALVDSREHDGSRGRFDSSYPDAVR